VFKSVAEKVFAFDLEWVPDPATGRAAYDLQAEMPDGEVVEEMWRRGGATEEDPRPYLKTVLCRIVSIAAVIRAKRADGSVELVLHSLPEDTTEPSSEAEMISRFLGRVGKDRPQLVGYNSSGADLPILLQRGVAAGISAADFCKRPEKPWQGSDYFPRYGDDHIDLMDVLGGTGRGRPSLNELATASGIPGKMGTDEGEVVDLWSSGEYQRIAEYNRCDALTTYLLWLRTAHFAGFFSDEQYDAEAGEVRDLLLSKAEEPGYSHLSEYLRRWEELSGLRSPGAL
jgi:predicted PolB exonuclease-like 3'-5' exonuclease